MEMPGDEEGRGRESFARNRACIMLRMLDSDSFLVLSLLLALPRINCDACSRQKDQAAANQDCP